MPRRSPGGLLPRPAIVALVSFLALAHAPAARAQGVVRGTVRSDATGAPVAGARIEMREAGRVARTSSDAGGTYVLSSVGAGTHRLYVVAADYDSLVVDVLLADDAPLRLDLALTPCPASLAPVRVLARAEHAPQRAAPTIAAEGDAWRLDGETLRRTPAIAGGDPLQALAAAPQTQMLPEAQTATHVRGGSADQNLFLLDGAPVYSPVHAGPVPSAFNPDVVESLVLHGAAPSARYGGALSSVVDVRTAEGVPDTGSMRGAFGPTSLRGATRVPLVADHVALVASARHSYSGLVSETAAESALPGSWYDAFGKLTLHLGRNVVTWSSFSAENGLGFPAVAGVEPGPASSDEPHNLFEWSSSTHALTWRRPLGTGVELEARAWAARLAVAAEWRPDSGTLAVHDLLHHDGASVIATRAHAGGALAAGVEAERFDATYAVARDDASIGRPALSRRGAPTIASAFVEDAWQPADGLALRGGVRVAGDGDATRLEPRLSATVRPTTRLALSASYARLHQYVQSLRNEESLVGTLVAPDLFVASDAPAVPVAGSDELSAAATFALDGHTRLRIDAYARRLRGLVLTAPATAAPFATDGYETGTGDAWGTALSFEHHGARLAVDGHYAVGTTTRYTADGPYHPAFAAGHAASLALAYRAGRRTSAHAALWAATGRRTTLLADPIEWDARDAFSDARELSGTPSHAGGPLDGAALPGFLRVDVGVRHTLARWRGRDSLTGSATVSNVLGRENVAGYVVSSDGRGRSGLSMLPPALLLGLEWGY